LQGLDEKAIASLLYRAGKARETAYAPYSGFRVGAALLCSDGSIFTGCNVENVSYGASNCAERTAVFTAISAGHHEFDAIAIAAGDELILPCGICRQVLAEFSPDIVVICGEKDGFETYTLDALLPHGFNHFCAEGKNKTE